MLVKVIKVIIHHSRTKDKNAINTTKQLLTSIFGITFLFGMSWVFGAFTISDASPVFNYLFTIFTSLQGFFIFIFFCVLGKEARELWITLLCCRQKQPGSSIHHKTSISSIKSSGGKASTRKLANLLKLPSLHSIYIRPSTTNTSTEIDYSVAPSAVL